MQWLNSSKGILFVKKGRKKERKRGRRKKGNRWPFITYSNSDANDSDQ
jgi:hypothetical protein